MYKESWGKTKGQWGRGEGREKHDYGGREGGTGEEEGHGVAMVEREEKEKIEGGRVRERTLKLELVYSVLFVNYRILFSLPILKKDCIY
jgi:hypothetical protein